MGNNSRNPKAAELAQKNEQKESPYSIPYAKLPFDKMSAFGKGNLSLSGKAFDFLMAVSPFVDHDNRIVVALEKIRKTLFMQRSTFTRVKKELQAHGFLSYKEGHYYSGFHIQTEGKGEQAYTTLYKAYFSGEFRGWSLNKKRMLVHIVNFTAINPLFDVALEQLFDNSIKLNAHQQRAVSYFKSFYDLADCLVEMIQEGVITVQFLGSSNDDTKLVKKPGFILQQDTQNLKGKLHAFYGYTGQSRTSKNKAENHFIRIRLVQDPHLEVNQISVCASSYEIYNQADYYGVGADLLKKDTVNAMISYKKELFFRLGEKGLALYRNTLERYFEEKFLAILWYDMEGKMANYFMDFYLLEEIKYRLANVANDLLRQSVSGETEIADWTKEETEQLLQFFRTRASDNHLIQLDEALEEKTKGIETVAGYYVDLAEISNEWKLFETITYKLYRMNYEPFKEVIGGDEWISYMREWANQGILMRKKEYERVVEMLKETVFAVKYYFMRRRSIELDNMAFAIEPKKSEHAVPFYNWLGK